MEVVSCDNPERDYWRKRQEYAAGGIPEYWIIDPQQQRVTVLWLQGDAYVERGVFRAGQIASGPTLPEWEMDVNECFDSAKNAASEDLPQDE